MVAVGYSQNLLYKYGVGKSQTVNKNQHKAQIALFAFNIIEQLLTSINSYNMDSAFVENQSEFKPKTKEISENKTQDLEELKKEVQNIFDKNELEFPREITDEVVKKYKTMKKYNCGKRTLEQRVIDYANGLNNYGKFEQGLIKDDNTSTYKLSGYQETSDTTAIFKLNKEAFLKSAEEYIELHDSKKGDGTINLTEFLAKEAADANIDIENLSDEDAVKLLSSSHFAFEALDVDSNDKLDKAEVAALLWRMAVQDENASDITYADHSSFNQDLKNYTMAVLNLDETNMKLFTDYMKENKKAEALKILKENSNLSEKEFSNILNNVFKGLSIVTTKFLEP